MIARMLIGLLLGCVGLVFLTGCETTDPEPDLPQSEHSDMPWNTPRPGEGTSGFGGLFNQNR